MKVVVNKKEYELKFGLDFINALDKKYYIEEEGIKLGQGLVYVVIQFELGNPLVLLDLMVAGGVKEKVEEIKRYIEGRVDIEAVMNEFEEGLKKSSVVRFSMKKLGLVDNN